MNSKEKTTVDFVLGFAKNWTEEQKFEFVLNITNDWTDKQKAALGCCFWPKEHDEGGQVIFYTGVIEGKLAKDQSSCDDCSCNECKCYSE